MEQATVNGGTEQTPASTTFGTTEHQQPPSAPGQETANHFEVHRDDDEDEDLDDDETVDDMDELRSHDSVGKNRSRTPSNPHQAVSRKKMGMSSSGGGPARDATSHAKAAHHLGNTRMNLARNFNFAEDAFGEAASEHNNHPSQQSHHMQTLLAAAAGGGGVGGHFPARRHGGGPLLLQQQHQGYGDQPASLNTMGGAPDSIHGSLRKLEDALRSDRTEVQLEATKQIRQLLSVERDSLVQDVLDRNVVPQLLEFLKDKAHAALQVEALWALTNIAAGTTEHTHLLIKNNAVPTLVSLLDSTHIEVLEQAVWVLGNIAGDGPAARDTVIRAGTLPPLLHCMHVYKKISLLRIATWTLSNLCDGQPRPVFNVDMVLETIRNVLEAEDTEVLSHACWALSHLCDGPSPHIQAVVRAGVCHRLVYLLNHKSWRVVKPALRTVGNIVCAEDDQDYTQHILECGAVPCLRQLIGHSNREIQKEACWTLSNIAAGTIDQIQCVLDSGGIPPLVDLASSDSNMDPDVKIEACWVLLNATSCGSDGQIEQLVKTGCVDVLCNLLEDSSMVMMALEGLEKILQVGDDIAARQFQPDNNPYASLLNPTRIQALQNHRSPQIAKRATRMWKHHFVLCGICNKAYSLHSSDTDFCAECKCNVCVNCDCSVFHLSYQDKLWRELAEGEAEKEKSKKQSKKSKRQKKRLKDKKKKQDMLKQQQIGGDAVVPEDADQPGEPTSTCAKGKGAKPAGEPPSKAGKGAKSEGEPPSKAGKSAARNPANGGSRQDNCESEVPEGPASQRATKKNPKANNGESKKEEPSPTKSNSNDTGTTTVQNEHAGSVDLGRLALDDEQGPADPTPANDQYVDFLMESGSILELSKMMDLEEAC